MKNVLVLSTLILSLTLAGCAHSYARYQKADRLHTGVVVNYRLDGPVVFTITGRLGTSLTVPAATKAKDKTQPPTPAMAEIQLAPGWTYQVSVTRCGQQWAYEKGPVCIDFHKGDVIVEGKVYDFAIYAR